MKNRIEDINPSDCPFYLVSRVTLSMTSALIKSFTAAGVGRVRPAYLGVLWCLWKEEGVKMVDLGHCAGLERSTMTGLLDRMERDGFVVREPDPDDRRAHKIFLTEEGRRIREIVIKMLNETLNILFEGISAKDLQLANDVLRKVLENVHGENAT